jgi:superfamily II DNA or RNA helicase
MTQDLFSSARSEAAELAQAHVSAAMALLWSYHPCRTIADALRELRFRRPDKREYTQAEVKQVIDAMEGKGLIARMPERAGLYRLRDDARGPHYRKLLDEFDPDTLRGMLLRAVNYRPEGRQYYWAIRDQSSAISIARVALFTGMPARDFEQLRREISQVSDWHTVVAEAALAAFDGDTFNRIDAALRWDIADWALTLINRAWNARMLSIADWLLDTMRREPRAVPEEVVLNLAEVMLHQGAHAELERLLASIDNPAADALRACVLVQQSRWREAQEAFEAASKREQAISKTRRNTFPSSIAWYYPLALLAQRTPWHLAAARKFCLGEAGSRDPSAFEGWGMWVHACRARLGEVTLRREAFDVTDRTTRHARLDSLWNLLLAAWLGADALGLGGKNAKPSYRVITKALRERLGACRFDWLVKQVDGAQAELEGREPPPGFFTGERAERWREVLAALQALSTETTEVNKTTDQSRIVWMVTLGQLGAVEAIEPFEQKRGSRGWNKVKAISLSKLATNERLAPWDAKVTRTIKYDRFASRSTSIDRAAAVMALVGHPAVVFAHRPSQLVDLTEGTPTIDVIRVKDRIELRADPPLRIDEPNDQRYYLDKRHEREEETLRLITVVEDTPQRARVIRFTPAQRRAAQLIAGKLALPVSAEEVLKSALNALSGHFEVHADHDAAAREVPAESRLRAELAPAGDGLTLRLMVAPLGQDGPRLTPGKGRVRLMAAINGESTGTARDLGIEHEHVLAVCDALPFLASEMDESGACEWTIEDPEQALNLVETLPSIPAIGGVDWPKGKSVRVMTVDSRKIALSIAGERDWFRLSGKTKLEEGIVLTFEALLEASRGRSRFIPLGDGAYAALTQQLKERLADLAAVVETDRQGVRAARVAAAWLEEALEGIDVEADRAYRRSIEQLTEARDRTFELPRTLQATLRPYQEDGYAWAMRLAAAGWGGCLADDMGLGKTLQALAVMLTRAPDGAALVICPTSVCGNWVAEATRFAPSLNLHLYAETDRESVLAEAGSFDVVVVSYTLLQQAAEAFGSRKWHTVVADEAQAIKNASAKRSVAVFDLDADFRLALSGTPVENHLAELWSIMRFANPGLLGTSTRFAERFAGPIERSRDRDAQHTLRRLISPFVLRRTKAQVLHDLPSRTEVSIPVTPGTEEAAFYEALRRSAVAEATNALDSLPASQLRFNILTELTRLRRAACDPRLVSAEVQIQGAKVQAFAELATELIANGHKALVFSQFVDFLTLLRAPLDQLGIHYQYLDGSTPQAERTRRVASFQAGDGDLFLISLKAGGFGLNLTAADYVVIADPWWNPAAEDQATGRAHRIGQQRPVTVYRLVAQGTIEERIVELHHDKRALAESILAEGDVAMLPSTEELIELMAIGSGRGEDEGAC